MKNHLEGCTVVQNGECSCFDGQPEYVAALKRMLETREQELLEAVGPCTSQHCRLHYAHRGPCWEKP